MVIEYRTTSNPSNLIGRTMINGIQTKSMVPLKEEDTILTSKVLSDLKKQSLLLLNVRTSFVNQMAQSARNAMGGIYQNNVSYR